MRATLGWSIWVTALAVAGVAVAGDRHEGSLGSGDAPVVWAGRGALSIPAAAFRPWESGTEFVNSGRYLTAYYQGRFQANVDLPAEARMTRMSLYWYDDVDAARVTLQLVRIDLAGCGWETLADAVSPEPAYPGGYGVTHVDTIEHPVIDPSSYTYEVRVVVPVVDDPQDLRLCAVVIQYEEPPPTVWGTVSLTPAAFEPYEDGYVYDCVFMFLGHINSPGGGTDNGWYVARANLPHGATIHYVDFYFHGINPQQQAVARLQRTELGYGSFVEMATLQADGAAGCDVAATDVIAGDVVDNTRYAYWVVVDLPAYAGTGGYGVFAWSAEIEYAYLPPLASNTRYVSVPAAAFTSYEDGYDYTNHARYLIHHHSPDGGTGYMAPIELPQGAQVERIGFHWYDMDISHVGVARLQRTELGLGNVIEMASAATSGALGYGESVDDTIANRVIDNTRYAYWLVWDLPASDGAVKGCGVVVEYTEGRVFADNFESGGTTQWSATAP
jgi:hypothetical protein